MRLRQFFSDLALLPRMWRSLVKVARSDLRWEQTMALQAEATRTQKALDAFAGNRSGSEWNAAVQACARASAARDATFGDPLISGGRRA